MSGTENLVINVSPDLKKRLENFSNSNEISQSGAVRMLLNQNLPQEEK